MNKCQFIHITMLCVLCILFQRHALADFKATPEESQMCAVTIYNRIPSGNNPNWAHIHHYCDCVRFTNRAFGAMGKNKNDFSYYLSEAMDGCNYVIGHTTPDFEFLPEIYLQKATIYSLMRKDALAAAEFTKALNGNQKLAKAYIGLAEFFIKTNEKKKALKIVTAGLQKNPESKALKRIYKDLGGAMPYPTSTESATPSLGKKPDSSGKTIHVSPIEQVVTSGSGKIADHAVPATPPINLENQEIKGTSKIAASEIPRDISTPKNPWCRFCPDTPAPPPVGPLPSTPGVTPKAGQ